MKKSELKEIVKSVVDEWNTEEVHPEGLATYTYTGLQNDLIRECGDLLERAQQGKFAGVHHRLEILTRFSKYSLKADFCRL